MYDNLEVFITTYNRAEMFKDTLKTICEQSAEGFDIIIVDNASTDNTKDVVEEIKKQYPNRNIVFLHSKENIGVNNNLQRAMQLAKKEWAMIFHDDDFMHPEYIQNAMELLKQNPDAVIASCTYTPSEHPNAENWENFSGDAYVGDVKDFAALLFGYVMHNFASTIYKTSILKEHVIHPEFYGKIWDRPFMMDIAKHGKSIILKDPYIRYRIHSGQDTNNEKTGPFANEWFALLNCYKGILGNSWFDKYGLIYNSFVHSQLKLGYNWMQAVKSKMTFKEFKKQAAETAVIRGIEVHKTIERLYKFPRFVCRKIFYGDKC